MPVRCPFLVAETKIIASFGAYLSTVKRLQKQYGNLLFRGQARRASKWQLLPKAYREEYYPPGDVSLPYNGDRIYLEDWLKEAASFINPLPTNVWMQLAIAQHNGFPTRLLDWSTNPLAAAYFAAIDAEPGYQPAIYVYPYKDDDLLWTGINDPFDLGGEVHVVSAYKVDERIVRQSGYFTIHPVACGTNHEIIELVIKSSYVNHLIEELSTFGINEATIFPGLEAQTRLVTKRIQQANK